MKGPPPGQMLGPGQPSAQPFYLGGNKKMTPSDGISDEERKIFGIEKYLYTQKRNKQDPTLGKTEQGIDLISLGLKLNSPMY